MWETLREESKQEYKKMILAFASLTEMFAQKAENEENIALSPIINSKYQETVFQKVFKASAEDIGNTSYDAAILFTKDNGEEIKFLIGIKTFGYTAGDQKVAQFKANLVDWTTIISKIRENAILNENENKSKDEINLINKDLYLELATDISVLRNSRIDSSKSDLQGFKITEGEEDKVESVYHVLMPSKKGTDPTIYVGEISYDKINIEQLRIIGCTSSKNPCNFDFTDGNHTYRYTSADSQLYMDFKNQDIVKESWPVKYADDAYQIFENIAKQVYKEPENVITESHCWKFEVQKFSGFNSFYAVGSKLGLDIRQDRINRLCDEYKTCMLPEQTLSLKSMLEVFLIKESKTDAEKTFKVELREKIVELVQSINNTELREKINKLVYRPIDEVYIPIPNSSTFHKNHPDFFGQNACEFKDDGKKLAKSKEERKFTMVFEPSGKELDCYVTQDTGKAIESFEKQTYLGKWILKDIFQLKDYEPLTQKKLRDIGINGYRLYRTNTDKKIHFQFVWIDDENLPSDYCE